MTTPKRPSGELRVAVANLEYGGLSDTGDDSAWCKTMACLLDWAPDVLLVQEMNGRQPYRLHAHLWRTANELGLTPVLGPPSPDSVSGNHPAVLVNTAAGLRILDAGCRPSFRVSVVDAVASLAVSGVFPGGWGCGWLVRDDTLSMSERGRPSP